MSFIRKKLNNIFRNRPLSNSSTDTYKIPVEKYNSILYEVIKNGTSLESIKISLGFLKNIDDPIVTSGSFTGFTPLHVACMARKVEVIKLLVEDYKANVNVSAEDGTQPIHILCFYYDETTSDGLKALVAAGANIEAEYGQEFFSKYVVDRQKKWCSDFGEKMTLLTYAVIYNIIELVKILLECGADYKIRNVTNKTLLMHAFDKGNHAVAALMLCDVIRDTEFINARDDEGMTAIHYVFHPKKFGEFRYNIERALCDVLVGDILHPLVDHGPDIDPLINNDPETFILNTAAYRGSEKMLQTLLPYYHSYNSISHFRLLYYVTLPVEDPDKYILIPDDQLERADEIRFDQSKIIKGSITVILVDLTFRLTFGLPVPKEEIKLMDKFLSTNDKAKHYLNIYKSDFLNTELKKEVIKLGDESMSLYDFMLQIYDDKKLYKLLKKYSNLFFIWKNHIKYFNSRFEIFHYRTSVSTRIRRANRRIELIKLLEKISHLREHIPLPYEIVLDIIEYLSNNELELFIKAFLNPYPSYMCARNVVDPAMYFTFTHNIH